MAEQTLPPLPYAFTALEPTIDATTMEIHHDRHHQTYVNNLNAALKEHGDLQAKPLTELIAQLDTVPEAIRAAVRNNGGGHLNHTLFWEILTPGGAQAPSGELATAITSAFGDLESLKKQVNEAGAKRFGSGWAWVVTDKGGALSVTSTPNQDTPLIEGRTPILGIDVWEHAYYLKYQNKRPDYLAAIWSVINWDKVAALYAAR
jgi:Fe-Mn family superoxide dismutase